MYTNRVLGTAKCVLFIKVSLFQGVPISGVVMFTVFGTAKCVLLIEVPLFQGALILRDSASAHTLPPLVECTAVHI